MRRPSARTLFRMTIALLILALLDVLCTAIGLFYFYGEEGNPLIVQLAELLPGGSENEKIVLAVWLSKMAVIAGLLLAVHQVVKSEPVRDDKVMFGGLLISLFVYTGVISSWIYYYILVTIT